MLDTEIGNIFSVSRGVIENIRHKYNIPSLFTYDKISKIDNAKFELLFSKGLNDFQIAKELGMSHDGIYSHRMRHGYLRESFAVAKNNPLTQDNLEIILGIMMGDGHMDRRDRNAYMTLTHCPKQKDYTAYIAEKLGNLKPHQFYRKSKPDKRTGKQYESYWCKFAANPAFNEIYEHFYKDEKKRIPIELFDNYTW